MWLVSREAVWVWGLFEGREGGEKPSQGPPDPCPATDVRHNRSQDRPCFLLFPLSLPTTRHTKPRAVRSSRSPRRLIYRSSSPLVFKALHTLYAKYEQGMGRKEKTRSHRGVILSWATVTGTKRGCVGVL